MKKIFLIAFLILLCSCESISPRVVRVPVPVVSKIEPLPLYESESDKLTEEDRENHEKVVKAFKKDVEIYKQRDKNHQKLIEQHNDIK